MRLSANAVIMGEREIARGMIEHAFGIDVSAASAVSGPLARATAPL